MRSENVVINGPIFRDKAKEMAKKMNIENFSCSEGWFTRFKDRHGIVFRSMSGESGCVSVERVSDWKKYLPHLIKDYEPRNIFNLDETGLFYKMLPSKSLHFRGEKCFGGKHSKQRISVLVGANCDGTEKLPLLIIGKSQNPRCFKGVKSLSIKYEANSKSWMTSDIFKKYVLELDKRFSVEKRQVLLFVDNCPAHPSHISGLEVVKIIFFPANCTSVLQPMDQGVIKSLKSHYRRILLGHLIREVECSKVFDVNVLEAMQWLQRSWQELSAATIANCFHHAGFKKGGENSPDLSLSEDFSLLENVMQAAAAAGCDIPQGIDAATFINFDDDVIVSDKLSDEEIIQEIRERKEPETFSDSAEEMENIKLPTPHEMQNMLREMRKYYESKNEVSNKIFECIATLESDVEKRSISQLKQKKLTEYISIV